MKARSIAAAAVACLALVAAWSTTVRAQEFPQPLLGGCCSCAGKIRFASAPKLDLLQIGARFVPVAQINPFDDGFTLELSNANGVLFTEALLPGQVTEKWNGRKWTYKNPAAKTAGGLFSVNIWELGDGTFRARAIAYADLSGATLANMTTLIVIGASPFFDTADWEMLPNGWRRRFP